jgi:hypothetical protein
LHLFLHVTQPLLSEIQKRLLGAGLMSSVSGLERDARASKPPETAVFTLPSGYLSQLGSRCEPGCRKS